MRADCIVCACVIIFDMVCVQANVYKSVVYTVTNPVDGMNLFKCARFSRRSKCIHWSKRFVQEQGNVYSDGQIMV